MNTVLINFFAGPGAGKSTLAAGLFHYLKYKGYSAELVTEYAKEWAWEGRSIFPLDQLKITTEQFAREARLYGKVDYIITDSPTRLSKAYTQKEFVLPLVEALEEEKELLGVRSIDIFVNRTKPYVQKGRFETEAQAVALDDYIKTLLSETQIQATSSSSPMGLWDLIQEVLTKEAA